MEEALSFPACPASISGGLGYAFGYVRIIHLAGEQLGTCTYGIYRHILGRMSAGGPTQVGNLRHDVLGCGCQHLTFVCNISLIGDDLGTGGLADVAGSLLYRWVQVFQGPYCSYRLAPSSAARAGARQLSSIKTAKIIHILRFMGLPPVLFPKNMVAYF